MRFMLGLLFGIGVIVFPALTTAQDGTQAIQVVVGKDGSIKVVDPRTGNELPSIILRSAEKPPFVRVIEGPGEIVRELTVDQRTGQLVRLGQDKAKDAELEKAKKELNQARKQLEKLLDDLKKEKDAKDAKKSKDDEYFELEVIPGPDGKPKSFLLKKVPPQSLDNKVDRVMREIYELRRDINELKKQLDAKKGPPEGKGPPFGGPGGPRGGWGWPGGGWDKGGPPKGYDPKGPEPKGPPAKKGDPKADGPVRVEVNHNIDPKTLKQLEDIFKKYGIPSDVIKKIEEKKTKPEPKQPIVDPKAPTQPASGNVEARLDRILAEVEALRKDIQKGKGKK